MFVFVHGGVILAPDLFDIDGRLRHLDVHGFQRRHDDLRYGNIAEPFVVRGDHEPRRLLCIAFGEDIVVCPFIVVPAFTLGVIRFADLPAFSGIIEPLLESLQLLILADVEKELENDGAVGGMAAFEVVDLRISLRPDGLRH